MKGVVLSIAVAITIFMVLTIIQYVDFMRSSLETYGYHRWDLYGFIGFYDGFLRPVVNVSDGISTIRVPVNITLNISSDGYTLVDSNGVEILKAKFHGRDVLWYDWIEGRYVNIGFSPFLVIWPNKPKPILLHLLLRQVDIRYLGMKQDVSYDWIISEDSRFYTASGGVIYVKRIGVFEVKTPLVYVHVNISTPRGTLFHSEAFTWFYVEYKGSLPINLHATIPVKFVNREFISKLNVSSMLGNVSYIAFTLSAVEGSKIRAMGGTGVIHFIYPILGGLLSGVGVVLYRWGLRRFLKHI